MAADPTVVAAGTVLWRVDHGVLHVGLVHRPRYDDWSLPKGKLDERESLLACAARETLEETGHRAVLGRPIGRQRYEVRKRSKVVHFWAAAVLPGDPVAVDPDEVDEVRFVPVVRAREMLSYPRDARMVERLPDLALDTSTLVLLRHAKAVGRDAAVPDTQRPLTARGQREAERLVATLAALGVSDIRSSDALRCQETVAPYARSTAVPVQPEPRVSERGHQRDPGAAGTVVTDLLTRPGRSVLCSHRPVLPALRAAAAASAITDLPNRTQGTASALVLHHRGGVVLAAEHHGG